jgi:hypothetical protein
MGTRSISLYCLISVLTLASQSEAKEWRGIVPLRSTRQDVERILGSPTRQTPADANYDAGDVRVFVTFSEGDCNKWPYGWDVPAGTVQEIHVYPTKVLPLSEINLDPGKYRETLDVHHRVLLYADEEEGFDIVSHESDRRVHIFSYYPPAKERHRQCYENIRGLPQGRPRAMQDTMFDSYGYVSPEEEKRHLDGFAQALLRDGKAEGYIFGYAGRTAYEAEGKARAERAKKYVVEKYGVKPERVWAVEAGHSTYHAAELYVLPRGGATPRPDPDIRPSSVRILKGRQEGPATQTPP